MNKMSLEDRDEFDEKIKYLKKKRINQQYNYKKNYIKSERTIMKRFIIFKFKSLNSYHINLGFFHLFRPC